MNTGSRNFGRAWAILFLNGASLLILPPLPPAAHLPTVQIMGPWVPLPKGIPFGPLSFSIPRATRIALAEMPGAVVVVEEEALRFLPRIPDASRFFRLNMGRSGRWNPIAGPNGPLWVDPTAVFSSHQPQGYPIGWGYN